MQKPILFVVFAFILMCGPVQGQNVITSKRSGHIDVSKLFKHSDFSHVSCQVCHGHPLGGLSSLEPYLAAVKSAEREVFFTVSERLIDFAEQDSRAASIQLGAIRAVPLNNELLRSHFLSLGDRAALMVVMAPGKDASIQKGDIVVSIAGKEVSNLASIRSMVEEDRGSTIKIALIRKGKEIEVETLAKQLAPPETPYRIGVQVEPPSEAMRAQLDLFEDEGLLVTLVVDDSPAAEAKIKVHDILLRAGKDRLSNFQDLKEAINATQGGALEIVLMRGGKERTVTATPTQQPKTEPMDGVCRFLLDNHPEAVMNRNAPATETESDGDSETERRKFDE